MVEEDKDKNRVINYLDINAQVNNDKIKPFNIEDLQKTFPEMDEFTLKTIESEWRKARNMMINLKF